MIALIVLAAFGTLTGFVCLQLVRAGMPGRPARIGRVGALTTLAAACLALALSRVFADTPLVQWVWIAYLMLVAVTAAYLVLRWPELELKGGEKS